MERFSFWQRWLFVVSLIITAFGAMMAFLNGTVLFEPFNSQTNAAFWDTEDIGNVVKEFQHWIYGVLGSAMVSWGILLAFITHYPFGKKEKWSWNCLVLGLLIWFLIDTPISLYFKVYFNAAFNTVLLVSVLLPLVLTRQYFTQAPE